MGVRRGPEINSDHYLGKARTTIRLQDNGNKVEVRSNNTRQLIKPYRLTNTEITQKFRNGVDKMTDRTGDTRNCNLNELWKIFKNMPLISWERNLWHNQNKQETNCPVE